MLLMRSDCWFNAVIAAAACCSCDAIDNIICAKLKCFISSFFHWLIRLILFVVLWAVTYGIIAVVKWLTDNWVLVLCIMGGVVAVVGIAAVIAIIIRKRKNKVGLEVSADENN